MFKEFNPSSLPLAHTLRFSKPSVPFALPLHMYVFTRSPDGVWTQQAYIKASNPYKSDLFGDFVSLYEDTLVITTPFEDSNARKINGNQHNNDATHSGAVYVRKIAP